MENRKKSKQTNKKQQQKQDKTKQVIDKSLLTQMVQLILLNFDLFRKLQK